MKCMKIFIMKLNFWNVNYIIIEDMYGFPHTSTIFWVIVMHALTINQIFIHVHVQYFTIDWQYLCMHINFSYWVRHACTCSVSDLFTNANYFCPWLQARDSLKDSVAKGMDRGGGSVMDRLSPQPARSPVRSPVPASSPMAVTNLIANR